MSLTEEPMGCTCTVVMSVFSGTFSRAKSYVMYSLKGKTNNLKPEVKSKQKEGR